MMSKNARSGLAASPFGVSAARRQASWFRTNTCPFTVLFIGCFSDALSIQSYGARPQAETLEVVLQSTAGLNHGQERTAYFKDLRGARHAEVTDPCAPREGGAKSPHVNQTVHRHNVVQPKRNGSRD